MASNKVVLEFELQGNATEKTQSLRAQMRQLREELARLPEGTAEFNKVQRELGALTDKVGDLGKSVNTLAGDPLERLNNSFGMIGNSLMSLDFGAATTGLQGVSSAISDFKFNDLSKAAKGFGNTMLELGGALLTNPLFLIAGTIALIATNMEKVYQIFPSFEKALIGIGNQERAIAIAVEARAEASKKAYDQSSLEVNQMKLLGKTENEILQYRMSRLKTSIQDAKVQLDTTANQAKMQIETAKRNREILEGIIKFINAPLTYLLNTVDNIGKLVGKDFGLSDKMASLIGGFIIDPKETETELQKVIVARQDAIKQMESDYAGFQLQLKELDKKNTEDKKVENVKQQQSERESAVGSIKQIQERNATRLESERRTGLDLSKMSEDLANSRAAMEIAIEEQKRQTILEGEIALKNARLQIASQVVTGLMDLNSAMTDFGLVNAKKSFQINKALGIAQASIATYEGAAAAFTTASKSAITIAFPGYPAVMAGVAVAAGLAKVAKIAATKFNPGTTSTPSAGGGGLGGGGGMGGGGSTSAPAIDLSFLNNKKTGAQPLQTYVLATNVTSAQDAQQKILDQSKLIK